MTLNALVIEYQTTRCDFTFDEIYRNIYRANDRLVEVFARRYQLDDLDVESVINEKIYDITITFEDRGNFLNAVMQAIKYGCIDLARKRTREDSYRTPVMLYDEDDDEYYEMYEEVELAPTSNETDIINAIQKSLDQRQLIETLLQDADKTVYETISAFNQTDSYRQAAKLVGTCHKTVQARIMRLSARFNRAEHGEPSDYFTTPVERVC